MRQKERAPYGRQKRSGFEPSVSTYAGETYYDRPVIKPSHYGWLISTYFFIGGLAGAAQIISTVTDFIGRSQQGFVVKAGRYLALGGSLISPALLIADLETPQRWYNMLRIFRKTSPMSFGAWTLAAFGTFNGATVAAQLMENVTGRPVFRWLARVCSVPAAITGAVMTFYTGTLLAATSVPLWAANFKLLPALFAASATATAASALSLIERLRGSSDSAGRLEKLALIATGADLALNVAMEQKSRQEEVNAPLEKLPLSLVHWIGVFGLGLLLPLILRLINLQKGGRGRNLSIIASLATLIGGFITRAVIIFAGNESARRPKDYFQFTQPNGNLSEKSTKSTNGRGPDRRKEMIGG